MNSEELISIIMDYKSRLKYLPTGIKQLLVSQLLLDPLLMTKMNQLCTKKDETNFIFNQMICQNIDLYKNLYHKYISTKPLGNISLDKIKTKYFKASALYTESCSYILKDKNKKYDVVYKNAKKIKKLIYDMDKFEDNPEIKIDLSKLDFTDIVYLDVIYHTWTPLMYAIYKKKELVVLLLEKGSNPNYINFFGYTPLKRAIQQKDLKIVELLVKYGANIEKKDNYGNTALMYTINLISEKSTNSDIEKLLDIALFLINNGANINALNDDNNTAAFLTNNNQALKFLIDNNIDINIYNNQGNTVLMYQLSTEDDEDRNKNIYLLYKTTKNYGPSIFTTMLNHKNNQGKTISQLLSWNRNLIAKQAIDNL